MSTLGTQCTEVLAIIPARGGSKSVPFKNIAILNGRPLIYYTIQQALETSMITRVLVSTDDAEIADIARRYGAEVPFLRPAEIAGDLSVDIEYMRHALLWLVENEGYRPDVVVNLRPSEPMRQPATINAAIRRLIANPAADCVRSVRLAKESPFKMWLLQEDGLIYPATTLDGVAEPYNQPRQALPIAYWQDGYIDVAWSRTILELNSTTGGRVLPFEITEQTINIDYPDELKAAEQALIAEGHATVAPKPSSNSLRHPS
jgi:CMP-N,N'-diacetyllegionaminic acid synthase